MNAWNDFNNAEKQQSFEIMPNGTIAPVLMKIRPGSFDDPANGWTGGYATRNQNSGAVYLDCEFVLIGGQFAKRKVWTLIGLHSSKGPNWANMGRTMIRSILNSSRGVADDDETASAQAKRQISGFEDLNGIEFLARISIEKGQGGYDDKNVIQSAVMPGTKAWTDYMASGTWKPGNSGGVATASAGVITQQPASSGAARPSWAN